MRRVEAANRSLTVAALNLIPECSATFDTNFMMQVLTVAALITQYAPLVPVLMAALSKAFGYSSALAFNQITGLVYCLLPAALFVFVWRLLRAPGWGLVVALAYSLLSPTELLVPDDDLGLQQLLRARRL